MTRHKVDVYSIALYVAGGGMAAIFGFLGVLWPIHATQFIAAGGALVSIAGVVRVIYNPTAGSPNSPTPSTDQNQSSLTVPKGP